VPEPTSNTKRRPRGRWGAGRQKKKTKKKNAFSRLGPKEAGFFFFPRPTRGGGGFRGRCRETGGGGPWGGALVSGGPGGGGHFGSLVCISFNGGGPLESGRGTRGELPPPPKILPAQLTPWGPTPPRIPGGAGLRGMGGLVRGRIRGKSRGRWGGGPAGKIPDRGPQARPGTVGKRGPRGGAAGLLGGGGHISISASHRTGNHFFQGARGPQDTTEGGGGKGGE